MDDPQDSHHPDDMYRHSDGRGPVDNDLSMRDDGKPPNSGMGGDPQDSLGGHGHGHGHGMTNDGSLNGSAGGGGMAIRPIFLGNLSHGCLASDVEGLFLHPVATGMGGMGGDAHDPDGMGDRPAPFAVDRVDMKRGYCFVFLKDADTLAEKDRVEQYVADIGGMNINNVSKALRAEFARGDGRIKRKEDERRKKITPSETLFVVNFHEETTKREDLQMLFEPFGELVRIDMKRNYAFVQFRTVDEAQRAKDATNGGKLDQSEITVEFVARRMGEGDRRRDDRGGYRGDRGGYRGDRGPRRDRDYRRDDRYDDRGGYRGDRYGGPRDRRDYRRRSRSRSRSPGYRGSYDRRRSRSPEMRGGREYDDHRSRPSYRRSRSPEVRGGREYEDRGGRDEYRADRGYRSERGYGEEGR